MEKPGKRQRGKHSGGLLRARAPSLAAFLLFLASPLAAISVSVEVSGSVIEVGSEVTVLVTAYGATLGETSLDYGTLPAGFELSGGKKEAARLAPPERNNGEAMPSVVFTVTFRAVTPGVWDIGPFVLRAGNEGFNGGTVNLTVPGTVTGIDGGQELRWAMQGDGVPRAGSGRTIALMGPKIALSADILCPAPENALLEPMEAPAGGGAGTEGGLVTLASYRWTPLVAGDVALPSAQVSGLPGGMSLFSVPASVTVYPAVAQDGAKSVLPGLAKAFSASGPSRSAQAVSDTAHDTALLVERLARLRSEEYRSLFPGKTRAERLTLERDSGLGETLPVPPAAWKLPAVLGSAIFLALALFFSLLSSKIPLFGGAGLAAGFLAIALAFFAVSLYIRDTHPAGVAEGGPLYNVPEYGSRTLESIPDGTALFGLREAGDWAYVEGVDGARGWIPRERFRPYSGPTDSTE